ncbi:MAG TPA: hypothetical protein EYP49_15170 [Anaerolineae bacterium]|nr:hypothetical protein [Anaerolineae bacterium]
MELSGPPRKSYPVEIFTNSFKVEGQLEPIGRLMDALNNPERDSVLMRQVTVSSLSADGPLSSFALEEIVLNKNDFLFIYLADEEDRSSLNLLKKIERMIIYLPLFVIRADFHLGGETRFRDMLDTLSGTFLPVTDAAVFPLFAPKVAVPSHRDLLLINKKQITLYHAEKS